MTTKETLSIHQPEDILGYIPHLLGYWPEDSLVAITMQGNTLGAALRVDLPARASGRVLAAFAEHVRRYLASDTLADGVVLALYTDDGWDDGMVVHRTLPLLAELHETLDHADLPVRDAWLVGPEYWRGAFCADQECCPVPGLPIERIRNSRLSAEMVYRGSTIGASPRSRQNPPVPGRPGALDPAVSEAESDFAQRMRTSWRSGKCLDAVLEVWSQVLDDARIHPDSEPADLPTPQLAGFLRSTLGVPGWRDAVMIMAAAGIGSAKAGAAAFGLCSRNDDSDPLPFDAGELALPPTDTREGAGKAYEAKGVLSIFAYADVLLGVEPAVPDWGQLDALHRVLSYLCVQGEMGDVAAAALTLQGWIAWCKGSGSVAHACLTRANSASPGYRLAELLDEVLGQGSICAWASRPESAWGTYKGSLR
ncbi:DUF4192 domain-containing protein [Arthrobacter sp. StoSoilB13]|uniref:DUF4192 domain-containing protein n=1 Tax=Arthrobacter sp. StoSoilB13 TaxID=2830993 RepID=UPI001CC78360|nr:DUF4192 domain-containing protein [Arthrobacter sp. StoSoilB13]BCW47793.1 hypothetical protein StoSoilB13_01350 [Arthrobacter sp. StoSoilB13]